MEVTEKQQVTVNAPNAREITNSTYHFRKSSEFFQVGFNLVWGIFMGICTVIAAYSVVSYIVELFK